MSFEAGKRAIVRIYCGSEVVGTGFLVADREVMTCAHVVNACVVGTGDRMGATVTIDFPFSGQPEKYEAQVTFYVLDESHDGGADSAILELSQAMGTQIQPIQFVPLKQDADSELNIFGFPKGDTKGRSVTAVTRGRVVGGWYQIEDTKQTGMAIEPGFSGAPVWSETERGFVGMVVARDGKRPEAKVGFMIPQKGLVNALAFVQKKSLTGNFSTDLQDLASMIAGYDDILGNMLRVYDRICPKDWFGDKPRTLKELFRNLEEMSEESLPIHKFVAGLVLEIQQSYPTLAQELQNWGNRRCSRFSDVLAQMRRKNEELDRVGDSYLMIVVKEHTSNGKSSGRYWIQAWVVPDSLQCRSNDEDSYKSLDLPNSDKKSEQTFSIRAIQGLLKYFLTEIRNPKYTLRNLTIELFLPDKLLNFDFEHWLEDVENSIPEKIGFNYHVHLRSSERLTRRYLQIYGETWKKRWEIFLQIQQRIANECLIQENISDDFLFQEPPDLSMIGFKLSQGPMQFGDNSTFADIQMAALPIAVWLRQPHSCQEFDQLFECPVNNIPATIRVQRRVAFRRNLENHVGQHLSLLWEDYDRLPPDTLEMRMER